MVLKEDCPLRVSKETANRPQLKACGKPAESRVDSESNENMRPRQDVQFHIPNWKCPPNVAMDCSWHVAAAEESQEVKVQNDREARVLEACYPRPSAIPPNPSVASDASSGHIDDSQVPAIPLHDMEEDDEVPQATMEPENLDTPLSDASVPLELPTIMKPDIAAPGVGLDADAAAAAAAAYRATLKWKQQGSLIDPDLLISILCNPDMIRKLVDERGFSADSLNGRKIGEPSSSGSSFGPLAGPKMVTGVSTDEAILKLKELGSLIDPDLLISILSNPEMIRKLVDERGLSADSLNGRKIDEPSSSGSGPLTGPKMVTRGSTDEPSLPGTVGVAPFSWTPSEPFRRSGVDEVRINNLINELRTNRDIPCSAPAVAITPVTGPAPRPDFPRASLNCVAPDSVPNAPSVIAPGTGPSLRPDIPRASLNCVAPHSATHSVCPIPPSVATAPGIGPFPRPDFPMASFYCVPPPRPPHSGHQIAPPHTHTVGPMAPSVAMTAGTGTPLKPDISISNLPVVSHTVPQNAPSMEYLKSLIRKHGSGQETPKIDQVEVGKPQNHQQGPLISIQPQPTSAKPHCKFFNTPRGCRNGVNCRFQHVLENHPNVVRLLQDAPDAKKMKLTGEFGTNK